MKNLNTRNTLVRLFAIFLSICVTTLFAQTVPVFSGRFGGGIYAYYPEAGDNTVEPSFRGLVSANHFLSESIHGTIDARIRRDVTGNVGRTRVYEAWLGWQLQPDWEVQAGRLGSRGFGGIGFLDGGRFIYSLKKNLELSIYGGNEPDLNTFGFGTDVSKYGLATEGHTPDNHLMWGVSLLEQRYQGVLDRRMLTQNISLMPTPRSYIYQTAELDFAYRENGKDKSGLRVSDFHINSSEAAGSQWRFQESVGFRRGFKMLRSMRDIADTLFESDPVYDGSVGANWRLIPQIEFHTDIRYQRKQSTKEDGTSDGAGITANTNSIKPLYAFIDTRYNNNLYYSGTLYSISFEKEIVSRLSPRIGYSTERNNYRNGFGGGSTKYNRDQYELSVWYWLSDWSAGITGDFGRVNDQTENRYMFDIGYRIPTHQ